MESSLDIAKRKAAERPHTLNLEKNLTRNMKLQTDVLVNEFLSNYEGRFEGPIDEEILVASNTLRRDVLNMLEKSCLSVLRVFGKSGSELDPAIFEKEKEYGITSLVQEEREQLEDYKTYKNFIQRHGWDINGLGERHAITRDELAYELCEFIRKIYYVYVEDKIPTQYKIEIVEKYNLKVANVTENE